ncbi:parathyroid hormone [Rhea pennata]|uniref:parathyroid hormone n=1 Tax=Rhea pennata TaxID=8795 RepID=UPI002E26C99C
MTSIQNLAKTAIIFYAICFFTKCDGRPMMKRSVSEMQLMHNLGEHRHAVERQDWLQMKLQDVHSALDDDRTQRPRNKDDIVLGEIRSRRLLPEHLRATMQKKSIDLDKAYMDVLIKTKP